MKLPARFPARIMRHCQTLIAAWRYSQPGKSRAADDARQRSRKQKQAQTRTHAAHAASCDQAYRVKMKLVSDGRGHHTLRGMTA